jgi:uncharacterized protein
MNNQNASIRVPKKWGARFMQFPLTRIALAMVFVLVPVNGLIYALALLGKQIPGNAFRLGGSLLIVVFALLAYSTYVMLVEKRPAHELSRAGAAKELALGLFIGTLFFSVTMGILALAGAYEVAGMNSWRIIFSTLPTFIVAGFVEEIIMRGIIFRILEEWLGSWIALAISATIFGFGHMGNPGATLLNAGAIAIEAGIMLAAVYMLTRRLWLCIGLHVAWNAAQGSIFSVAVSGMKLEGLFKAKMIGPEWLTGGAFGAEASLVAVLICGAGGLYFIYRAIKKGRVIQPYWKKTPVENLQILPSSHS